jgi:hypothetical protein
VLDGRLGRRWFGVGRVFFFLKKKEAKKTLFTCTRAGFQAHVQVNESFLVLFFKKEPLPLPQ